MRHGDFGDLFVGVIPIDDLHGLFPLSSSSCFGLPVGVDSMMVETRESIGDLLGVVESEVISLVSSCCDIDLKGIRVLYSTWEARLSVALARAFAALTWPLMALLDHSWP